MPKWQSRVLANLVLVPTALTAQVRVGQNPATAAVEVNNRGNVTGIVNPRFARVTLAVHF